MRTIRENVFETNSSSMHAIVVSRNTISDFSKFKGHSTIDFDLGMDFSSRCLIPRKNASEKASYIFHLICSMVCADWPYHYNIAYTKEETSLIKRNYKKFEKALELIRLYYRYNSKLLITFSDVNLKLDETSGTANIESQDYSSLGCYGHNSLCDALFLNDLVEHLKGFIAGKEKLDDNSVFWMYMDTVLSFVLDDNSIIIQGSDEMDDSEIEKQKKLVIKYIKKNKGDASVIWPLGG